MAQADTKLNPQEKDLVLRVTEAERKRLKLHTGYDEHYTAIAYYDAHLLKLQKKLNPRGYYS